MIIQSEPENTNSRVLVFTPTYNERDNIPVIVEEILKQDPKYNLLIVDDNSPDGTGQIVQGISRDNERVVGIVRKQKLGLGTAHKLAMIHSLRSGYDVLVTMDADFSHDPKDIPRLIESLSDSDFVIGSRYMLGGRIDYPFFRRTLSITANRLARAFLGVPLHEFTTSFRAFRTSIFDSFDFSSVGAQGYSFFLESVVQIHRHGYRCAEIPLHFRDRLHGRSKIPRFEIARGAMTLSRLFASGLLQRHPRISHERLITDPCQDCGNHYLVNRPKRSMGQTETNRHVACMHCGAAYTLDRRVR